MGKKRYSIGAIIEGADYKMSTKRCIVHIPNHLDPRRLSGSQIRPIKMKEAFEKIGYDVDFVSGYGIERKHQIKSIQKKIRNGVNYDFVYSESSTMPTLLTEKNHLPIYPTLDFGFFSFCKRNNIKIGLFYRDIYWKFPAYKETVKGVKFIIALLAYKYDLKKYSQLLDAIFLPSLMMAKYLDNQALSSIAYALPPGADINSEELEAKAVFYRNRKESYDGRLRLFYVGGIGRHYKFDELIRGVSKMDNVDLTVCCRENEWNDNRKRIEPYCGTNIHIVHASGPELIKYYREADVCLAYFQQDEYRKMAMPIKIFEYLSYTIPIITTCGTAAGQFVEENEIGWCIGYSENEICEKLSYLCKNYDEIIKKHENSKHVLKNNTWKARANEVYRHFK